MWETSAWTWELQRGLEKGWKKASKRAAQMDFLRVVGTVVHSVSWTEERTVVQKVICLEWMLVLGLVLQMVYQ